MPICRICRSPELHRVLDLGPQPVSSHFASRRDTAPVQHNLALGVCGHCGVIQLESPFPFADLVPPYEWMTYREPEAHLDAVADQVFTLCGLGPDSRIAGLSYKDAPLLDRLCRRGVRASWQLDLAQDLGATDRCANIETVQGLLTPDAARQIVAGRDPVDLLIARHIAEHAEAPWDFMAALGTLLAPGGHLMIEVPDCRGNLERQDYTMIWEEHALYFTRETLAPLLRGAGCSLVSISTHPFAFENVLVMIGRKTGSGDEHPADPAAVERNVKLAQEFGAAFPVWTARYTELLDRMTADGRRVAAYGAGHLTCAFIHYHGLADRFAFVVDDTPEKQGPFLPKSGLPIVARERLNASEIAACLLGLSPDIEDRVIAKNTDYADAGGVYYSLFADSRRSLRKLLPLS